MESLPRLGCPGGSVVKNPPASAGDSGSIPGLGRHLEKEVATHSSILAWAISWIQRSLVGYSPWGCKRVIHNLDYIQGDFMIPD